MNKYDPFGSEENPFEQNRDPLLEEEEVYTVPKFQKKIYKNRISINSFCIKRFFYFQYVF